MASIDSSTQEDKNDYQKWKLIEWWDDKVLYPWVTQQDVVTTTLILTFKYDILFNLQKMLVDKGRFAR